MAQLLRGYPGRTSGLHNARIVNAAPNLFLPVGVTARVAVRTALDRRRSFRTSTKLFPPTIINPKPNLFLPVGVRANVALGQAQLYRRTLRNSTKLRPPTVINPAPSPPVFLPTLPRLLVATSRSAQTTLRRPASTKLRPPTIISPATIFLPTVKVRSTALANSQIISRRFKYARRITQPTIQPVAQTSGGNFFLMFN